MSVADQPVERERADWRLGNPLVWLGALLAGAAYLRFRGLSTQSFWFDESVTVTLVRRSLGDMLEQLPASESTPPLYYVLAWLWTHVFGSGEAGIRSLSAVFGVLTVAVAYLAARQLVNSRAGVFAAALVAFNPMLIWYSQEARAYALLVLLGSVSFWLVARIVTDGATRRLVWWWAAVSIAALFTHYFAFFLVAAEGIWLYRSLEAHRETFKRAVIAILLLCALGLAPAAASGGDDGRTAWIAAEPMNDRVADVKDELLTASTNIVSSNSGEPSGTLWPLAFIAVVAGLVVALRTRNPRYRTGARAALAIAAGAIAAPWVLSHVGVDYFKDRNLLASWVPWFIGVAAGLASVRRGWLGGATVAVIAFVGFSVANQVNDKPHLQRSDWRAAIRAIEPRDGPTLVAVEPAWSQAPLIVYGLDIEPTRPGAVRAARFIALGPFDGHADRWPQQVGAFRRSERKQHRELARVTYVAESPATIDDSTLKRLEIRDPKSLLVVGGGAGD